MSGLRALFETARLAVRPATDRDAPFVTSLWRDPLVMRHVGFPNGIPTAITDVPPRIQRGRGLDQLLIAEETETGRPIGQCLLGEPDADGVSEPDIKLVPEHWGRGYGRELWAALIDQLFLRSSCRVVRGTPSIANLASIRMQESAGMRRVGEGLSTFPSEMREFTVPVQHVVYEVSREEWQHRRVCT